MSAIAGLYNVPNNPEDTKTWGFTHAAHHRDVARVIYELSGFALAQYVVDPFDEKEVGSWIYQHQLMHNQINSLLGFSGYNLSSVDWENENLRSGWVFLNATEHAYYANVLGIG